MFVKEKDWVFEVQWRCDNCHSETTVKYPKGAKVLAFEERLCHVCGVKAQHWGLHRRPRCNHGLLAKENMKQGKKKFSCKWCGGEFEILTTHGKTWAKRIDEPPQESPKQRAKRRKFIRSMIEKRASKMKDNPVLNG